MTVVGYTAAHKRIVSSFGRASTYSCVDCGVQANDWSYTKDDPAELLSPEGWPYSLFPEYYAPRCRPCHLIFDRPEPQWEDKASYFRDWRAANPDKEKAKKAKYRLNMSDEAREKEKERLRTYRAEHKEEIRAQDRERYVRKRGELT